MERSLLLFENSVKSRITFQEYLKRLKKFRVFCNADSFDSLSRIEPAKLQEFLEDHIMLRKKQINPNSIPVEFFAIKSFLEINEVELKWRKVTKLFPAKIKKTGRRAYTTQEVQKTPPMIELTPAGSDDGFFFPPTLAVLYFGGVFLKVQAAIGVNMYLEFARPTLVKHNDDTCPQAFDSAKILLSGNQDVQFQIGDTLVLQRDYESCTTPFDEVYREQTP